MNVVISLGSAFICLLNVNLKILNVYCGRRYWLISDVVIGCKGAGKWPLLIK